MPEIYQPVSFPRPDLRPNIQGQLNASQLESSLQLLDQRFTQNHTRNSNRISLLTSWAFEPSNNTLYDFTTLSKWQPLIENFVDIFTRNPSWDPILDMCMPIDPILNTLSTDYDRFEFMVEALQRRELLLTTMENQFQTPLFEIQLGNMAPLLLAVEKEVTAGVNTFSLWDKASFEDQTVGPIQIGEVQIDFSPKTSTDPGVIYINGVQDHRNTNYTDLATAATVIRNRQKKIRHQVESNRSVILDSASPRTPGVEEFLIYTASHLLVSLGLVDASANVVIPEAEVTEWGKPGELGMREAQETFVGRSLRELSPNDFTFVINNISKYNPITPDFSTNQLGFALIDYLQERIDTLAVDADDFTICQMMVPAILSHIDTPFIQQFSSASPSSVAEFLDMISYIIPYTKEYRTKFYAYRNSFTDLTQQQSPLLQTRAVAIQDIFRLPFVNQTSLSPYI